MQRGVPRWASAVAASLARGGASLHEQTKTSESGPEDQLGRTLRTKRQHHLRAER